MNGRRIDEQQEARYVGGMAGRAEVTPDWEPVAVERVAGRGGRLVHGRGKLTEPRTVGDERFTARLGLVIATGSKPAIPPILGLAEVDFWTTHDVIRVERLPKSIVVLGGGAVRMTEAAARAAGLAVDVVVKRLPATFRGWLHAAVAESSN